MRSWFKKITWICILAFAGAAIGNGANAKQTLTKTTKSHSRATKHSAHSSRAKTAHRSTTRAASNCRRIKIKTKKGYRYKQSCSGSARGKTLADSPISADALNELNSVPQQEKETSTRPSRAYAVDGVSFFYRGRRVQIADMELDSQHSANDIARQRLQSALDSGEIAAEPIMVDDKGTAVSMVKVNGRDIRELLRGAAKLPPQPVTSDTKPFAGAGAMPAPASDGGAKAVQGAQEGASGRSVIPPSAAPSGNPAASDSPPAPAASTTVPPAAQ